MHFVLLLTLLLVQVDLVVDTIQTRVDDHGDVSNHTALQRAAEALVHEAYVRGSSDNIGVCVISISEWFDR